MKGERGEAYGGGDGEGLLAVGIRGKDAAVADEDADDEERAREVAQEGQRPVLQHEPDGRAAVQRGEGGVL